MDLEKGLDLPEDKVYEAVPAATVLLVRDGDDGIETLMLHKSSRQSFGDMWVFPGGRVDPDDFPPGRPDDIEAAVRRAAVREAAEETRLVLDPSTLVPFSHWMPPANAPKRFATWFFIAPTPTGQVVIDDGEIQDHVWARPADVLERRDRGDVDLAPPTWVSLHRLTEHTHVDAAMRDAAAGEVEHFETHIARTEGGILAIWHGDVGYGGGDPTAEGGRHRLWMLESGWRYERSG